MPPEAQAAEPKVLRTKLHPPPQREGRVNRPRLVAALDAGLDGGLILVAAPAGYGKTTLVCQWLEGDRVDDPGSV
jgi:LuxR family transcriptional regulator, maltose regulon positive regulatory protein